MKKRLAPESFVFPVEEIKKGFYSDVYFMRSQKILAKEQMNVHVTMQIFQRNNAILCGIDEVLALLYQCSLEPEKLRVQALHDGDSIAPWETVMFIEGNLADFIHLETVYLGILSRQTKIATNSRRVVIAAGEKPVLFFPSRFDLYETQARDGYAAHIGGMSNVSTAANASLWKSSLPLAGTIPHALIAAFGGDTVAATEAFARHIDPQIGTVALVDFDNDCIGTSLRVARALGKKLKGVRLDTSERMVDKSLWSEMGHFNPTGVNPVLVKKLRHELDEAGFPWVKIIVSGGFNAERIRQFEAEKVPVDVYAVGSSIFTAGQVDFTADIVRVNGQEVAKAGRRYTPNPRLEEVSMK